MAEELLKQLEAERAALITEIHEAFGQVTRENGASWSECVVIDNYGSEHEQLEARRSDKDSNWSELVEDQNWHPFPGIGGFSFIDDTGFRYYLPPTMIRFAKGDVSEWYPGHLLGVINRFISNFNRVYTREQLHAIAMFISFMARHDTTGYREVDDTTWQDALATIWGVHLAEEQRDSKPH